MRLAIFPGFLTGCWSLGSRFSGEVRGAFLEGVLRFPQGFWMVFCGEFVVIRW